MDILVTGAAGFIGYHTARRLLQRGDRVLGVDNLNDYYPVSLKRDRLAQLATFDDFLFERLDVANAGDLAESVRSFRPNAVVHLAAQAGVRYSLDNPRAYVDSNLVGFVNLLEECRHLDLRHLVYASSSSVYGANQKVPFSIEDRVDHPVSLYAATKKANELMAHVYSHLFRIPSTGLRFFTVYGPWGRPDMAVFMFTKAILENRPIPVFNNGAMHRDFTYIDDIVEGIIRVLDRPPVARAPSGAPYMVYNIGNHRPVALLEFIRTLESCLGRKARLSLCPMQPGDVPVTYADVDELRRDVGFHPATSLQQGLEAFVRWYLDYYNIRKSKAAIA